MIPKNFDKGVVMNKLFLFFKRRLLLFFYRHNSILPQLFTIAKTNKVKSILMVIFQCFQVVLFAYHKIISSITSPFMLVRKNDHFPGCNVKRNDQAFFLFSIQNAFQ